MPIQVNQIRKTLIILVLIALVLLAGIMSLKWIGTTLYPLHYKAYIAKYSKEYNVDPLLIAAIIRAESKYYKDATSSKGAIGLMQITPSTGKWIAEQIGIKGYSVEQLYDPETNIMMGCWYINNLKEQFSDIKLVLASYNGGRGNVVKWLKNTKYSLDGESLYDIPFTETKNYVERVEKNYKIYNLLYDDEDIITTS